MESKNSLTYWQEQREYFKEKTIAFKEMKKKREIKIMKEELNKSQYNESNDETSNPTK
jgi:hypothetical protein